MHDSLKTWQIWQQLIAHLRECGYPAALITRLAELTPNRKPANYWVAHLADSDYPGFVKKSERPASVPWAMRRAQPWKSDRVAAELQQAMQNLSEISDDYLHIKLCAIQALSLYTSKTEEKS